mgnify:CR=1 FL=1
MLKLVLKEKMPCEGAGCSEEQIEEMLEEMDGETITEDGKEIKLYDVWVDLNDTENNLNKIHDRLNDLRQKAMELIPAGLQAAAQANPTPTSLLKLLVQTSEPE